MENDLHKTFGEIFDNNISTLRKQLLCIQHITADRKKSEEWVRNLRFLDISKVPELQAEKERQDRRYARAEAKDPLLEQTVPSRVIPLTKDTDDDGEVNYMAVSWKWATPCYESPFFSDQQLPVFHYQIKRPGQHPHKSSFPDHYMDRVIRFAQSQNINKLWVDKECIYQKKEDEMKWPNDKKFGVQIMDVVYGASKCSAGLLTTSLTQQHEVDILSNLLDSTRSIFVDPEDEKEPKLQREVSVETVQMLILRILSDPRWSRGWIFQEDHLASARMILLIPCDERLRKDHGFGDTPGELHVNLATFRKAVTMFCKACPQYRGRWPNTEILGKAKQYNIWNKQVYSSARLLSEVRSGILIERNYSNVQYLPTTTNSVLDDILIRSLEKQEDRIAILANALKFPKRLDTGKDSSLVKPGNYSLSAALLALILINGEILMNTDWEQCDDIPTSENLMQHTLQSYLKICEYRFNPPDIGLRQSFIDRCRFKSPVITECGVKTKGFLFRLLPPQCPGELTHLLRLDDRDHEGLPKTKQSPWARSKHDTPRHTALERIIKKLNQLWPGSKLAAYLKRHLLIDQDLSREATPAVQYVLDMMSALYQALCDNQELRLARLASAPDDTEPTAIFIKPEQDGWRTENFGRSYAHDEIEAPSVKIFTTWDHERQIYEKERSASLEVTMFEEEDGERRYRDNDNGRCSMLTHGWVNGVWCVEGEQMGTYVFPLAGITPKHGLSEDGNGNKRKRGDEDEHEDAGGSNQRRRRLQRAEET